MTSATNVVKLAYGKYDYEPFDEKNSMLPKWLLQKGLMNYCDFLKSRIDIKRSIEFLKRSYNRKNRSKDGKKVDKFMIKKAKEDLKVFDIEYFEAKDVEKAFGELFQKK